MPEEYRDLVNLILRYHEGYTGDGRGGVGELPVGDRSTARKAIDKRDLRAVLLASDSAANLALDARDAAAGYAASASGTPLFMSRASAASATSTTPVSSAGASSRRARPPARRRCPAQ